MKWVRVIIQGSEIKDFCLKQGQCLHASEVGTPLLKLHLTAPPPPDHAPLPTHDPRDIKRSDTRETLSQATHRSGGPSLVCHCGFPFTSVSATHDPGIRGYSLWWPIYTGWIPPKWVSFFFPASGNYERVGILLVKVYERVRKSVTSVVKRPKSANRCILLLWKSRENVLAQLFKSWIALSNEWITVLVDSDLCDG